MIGAEGVAMRQAMLFLLVVIVDSPTVIMPPGRMTMNRTAVGRALGLTLLFGHACAPAETPPETSSEPAFTSRVVAAGLESPWEITWGPDDHLWVTERVGKRILRVDPADGAISVAVEVEGVYQDVSQDGLLGLALHPELLTGTTNDYVYVAYTYDADPGGASFPRAAIRRYTYLPESETFVAPEDVIRGLPAHDDHVGERLAFGPDDTLLLSIGDQGSNWQRNRCNPVRAQVGPTADEIARGDWSEYQRNYGWPQVAGDADDQMYAFEDWAASAPTLCADVVAAGSGVTDSVPVSTESSWSHPDRTDPLQTLFTVPNGYDFQNSGSAVIAAGGLDLYTVAAGVPGWADSLMVTSLNRGGIYRLRLSADGRSVADGPVEVFKSTNRYRDLAIRPDGRAFYIITDNAGPTRDGSGATTRELENSGAILEFSYVDPD